MAFTVKLADKIIQIENMHEEIQTLCKDYLIEDCTPDISLRLTQDDLLFEQKYVTEQNYSMHYLESLALLRKISNTFPLYNRMLVHGASISYEGKAYLFTAPSGTGKSTHIRLWRKYLGEKVKIVNGDKPFISIDTINEHGQPQPIIYGTPWSGKEGWQRNCAKPLNAICFIQRGTTNQIQRLNPEDCLQMLFNQVYLPDEELAVAKTLELIDALVKHVPLYLLSCDMSKDAVQCSFEALTGISFPN